MRRTVMEGNSLFLKKLDPLFVSNDLVDDTFVKKAITDLGGFSKFSNYASGDPLKREEIIEI